ncbi:MAG: septum site-determining protein MinC [Anaerolineaceae bacterium]|jgi:septum site-determining protein MinC
MQQAVNIKGVKDGLMITLGDGTWTDLQEVLFKHIEERLTFFNGARVALDVGNHILHAADMGILRDRLGNFGVNLWAVLSNSPTTEATAQVMGLATRLSAPKPERVVRTLDTNLSGESAVLIQRTLRSGFRLAYQGHVVVIGDVNPGAEIVAGGSVVVWGRLRGLVHAGADGNEEATVSALDMNPMQLRIANHISVTPQRKGKSQPEIARVQDGRVVAEAWNQKEGGR